jgi:hypothetical protein
MDDNQVVNFAEKSCDVTERKEVRICGEREVDHDVKDENKLMITYANRIVIENKRNRYCSRGDYD